MTNHPTPPSWPRYLLATVLAAGATMPCRADYLCPAPPSAADRQACELAKQDRPDALRRFVQRTRGVYGLYMPDYVSTQDVQRWDAARGTPASHPVALAAGAAAALPSGR